MGKTLRGCLTAVVVIFFGMVALVVIFGNRGSTSTTTTTTGTSASPVGVRASPIVAAASPPATAAPPSVATVGETVTAGNWSYRVDGVKREKTIAWSASGSKAEAKGEFLAATLTLTNIGKENFGLNPHDFELHTGGGITYKPDSSSGVSIGMKNAGTPLVGFGATDKVPPGVPVKASLVFDINPAETGLRLNLVQAKRDISLGQ